MASSSAEAEAFQFFLFCGHGIPLSAEAHLYFPERVISNSAEAVHFQFPRGGTVRMNRARWNAKHLSIGRDIAVFSRPSAF